MGTELPYLEEIAVSLADSRVLLDYMNARYPAMGFTSVEVTVKDNGQVLLQGVGGTATYTLRLSSTGVVTTFVKKHVTPAWLAEAFSNEGR